MVDCSNFDGEICREVRSQNYGDVCDTCSGLNCEFRQNIEMDLKEKFYKILELQEEIDDLNGEAKTMQNGIMDKMNDIRKYFSLKYKIPQLHIRYINTEDIDEIPFIEIICSHKQAVKIITDHKFEQIELKKIQDYMGENGEYILYINYPEYYR